MSQTRVILFVLAAALLATGCGKHEAGADGQLPHLDAAGDLATIQARGELVIVTRNAPTVSYIDRDGRSSGPEHDLAAAFAQYLEVTPRFVQVDSVQDMLRAVAEGRADMAAGSITRTPARRQRFTFGPAYADVSQEVVCNHQHKPRNIQQLAKLGHVAVAADTSYAERLTQLAREHPDLHWQAISDTGTEQLLARVAKGEYACTVADSNIVAVNRRYHPRLLAMFRLSAPQQLAWPMPEGSEKLRDAATHWLAGFKKAGKLAALHERYYGFIGKWNFVDKNTLVQRIADVFPKYDPWFTAAADQYDFSKWLLAAQAYQESHWNPTATSPTGVRGIMMLTQPTAKALGVSNRLDPQQSIMGGARYLREMENKLPDDIAAPQRYFYALAAYTIGYYHLRDAMRLAERHGKNPHSWAAVKQTLPLLMQKKYYRTTRYGYARGGVAVRYVQRIRDYKDVIQRVAMAD